MTQQVDYVPTWEKGSSRTTRWTPSVVTGWCVSLVCRSSWRASVRTASSITLLSPRQEWRRSLLKRSSSTLAGPCTSTRKRAPRSADQMHPVATGGHRPQNRRGAEDRRRLRGARSSSPPLGSVARSPRYLKMSMYLFCRVARFRSHAWRERFEARAEVVNPGCRAARETFRRPS